jgi:hypothetical protein
LDFRKTALSTLAVAISILLVFSFITAASGTLLDTDERIQAYSRCRIYLSKHDDLNPAKDFYDLRMIITNRVYVEDVLPNPEWSGPITANIYVYLPSDASSVSPSPTQGMFVPVSQQQSSRFWPEVERSGSFVRAYWRLSSERSGMARTWAFTDQLDYSLDFDVPQNASVTVYAYVEIASYTYRGVYYSQLADERMYWLRVSNTDETIAQPQAIETGVPTLILDTLGIDLVLVAVFSVVAFWHFKRYGQRSLEKTGVSEQGMLRADYSARHARTLGIIILVLAVAFLAILALFAGSTQLRFDAPYAITLLALGLALTLIAVGLSCVKPWAWYAAVGLMIINTIDYILEFTTATGLTIPLAPFILAYLIGIRYRFF